MKIGRSFWLKILEHCIRSIHHGQINRSQRYVGTLLTRESGFLDVESTIDCSCALLKISSKQLFEMMQRCKCLMLVTANSSLVDYFCSVSDNPGKTDLVCRKVTG